MIKPKIILLILLNQDHLLVLLDPLDRDQHNTLDDFRHRSTHSMRNNGD
ncbi:hypothetical protein [Parabacteroides goldsteinii]|uniref:Uncharacterized protein n=1 Tax=Parabacteroides goldsteinii TaxID=328812 RepID=A0A6G1ZLF6_9BACT|nr:hypothetical protein [Parabacteroides goldsteinii]MRX95260.1 hypothetical protein [Parabacteroides goldsteinii]MRY00398.1 hypothetical protein [Parabacteroides goldsteinii]MRY05511.1 hypothetical protein [Parabacteroides goldsteinii]MRY14796.1 hypothetical protein [Parabacteroides goldsteinii]MRY24068.1 hypothetical protein [Parabacteroides goldsteinii]